MRYGKSESAFLGLIYSLRGTLCWRGGAVIIVKHVVTRVTLKVLLKFLPGLSLVIYTYIDKEWRVFKTGFCIAFVFQNCITLI